MITTILVFGNPDPTFPCTSTAFLQSIKGLAGRCPFGWCVPCSRSGFHKWGHPKLAGWFIYVYFMEKPWKTQSKMDDSWGTPILGNPHMHWLSQLEWIRINFWPSLSLSPWFCRRPAVQGPFHILQVCLVGASKSSPFHGKNTDIWRNLEQHGQFSATRGVQLPRYFETF